MSLNAISSIMLKQGISEGFSIIKKIFKSQKIELVTKYEDLETAFLQHNNFIINTTKNISFRESKNVRKINDVYINLDIELQPKSLKFKEQVSEKKVITEILVENSGENHIIILGGPGAGKTTTVKHICQLLLKDEIEINFKFPILILLREISDSETIYSRLKNILGIEIATKQEDNIRAIENTEFREKYINAYLNSLNIVLILDGFDEIKPSRKDLFFKEIKSLMNNLSSGLVILTSRSASYSYSIDNSIEYEICDLSDKQVNKFVDKWFNDRNIASQFKKNIKNSKFYDLSLRPLTLAHLCAIYEKTKKFYDKPKSIYKKLVRLLIEEWDEERDINRESKYADFDNERKFEFLSNFAYDLTINYSHKIYSEEDFENSYSRLYSSFGLPRNEKNKVIKEIEEHNGIIIKSSYNSYEFVHKSMQEYLSAEYIVKLPTIPVTLIYDKNISNELAIAVSLSSRPDEYFFKLVYELFKPETINKEFAVEFFSRLEYEQPSFKESILIPFSFIYILDILKDKLYDFDDEFNIKYNQIFLSFCSNKIFANSVRNIYKCINREYSKLNKELTILNFNFIIDEYLKEDEKYYFSIRDSFEITYDFYKIMKDVFNNN